MNQKQIRAAVEAMLFACGEPIGSDKLAQAVQLPQASVENALEELRTRYTREDSGLCLLHLNTRWQLATKTEWADCVRRVLDSRRAVPLGPAAMETLTVIAYNQPVSRAFIEQVRGVDSSSTVTKLLDKGLIEEAGRLDLPGKPEVRPLACNVVDVRRGTTIADGKAIVFTVEHIMSALNAWHIDNCIVEMDGMEPPIVDGSSLPYFDMIREAGVMEQDEPALTFTPSQPVYVEGGYTRLVMIPGEGPLRISCLASFKGCPIDPQFYEFTLDTEAYREEIAPARTFVDYGDLKQLLAMGLGKGGSLDAAAIIHDGAIICKEALRFQNEIVRHKILDLIGDIYLTGRRITGSIIAIKPGHPKNVELAGALLREIAVSSQEKNNRETK